MVMPGDNTEMTVTLIQPIAMEEGLGFAIREGGPHRWFGPRYQDHQVIGPVSLRQFLQDSAGGETLHQGRLGTPICGGPCYVPAVGLLKAAKRQVYPSLLGELITTSWAL